MIEMVEKCLIFSFLGINAWLDIRRRKISFLTVAIWSVAAVILRYVQGGESYVILLGLLPGIFLLFLSKATRESIGMGDGVMMLVLGIYLGVRKVLDLFFLSLFLSSIWAGFLLLVKKKRRDWEFPFVPFLFLGYVGMCVLQL